MLPIRLSELPEAPLDVSQSGIFPVSDVPNDITYKLSLQQIPSLSANQNVQVKTSSYTVTKNDYNSVLYFNNEIATTVNLTIPNNNTKKIQPGYSIKIIRYNLGHVHIVPESGVTIYSPSGLYLHSKYSVATLTKIDNNQWILTGHVSLIPIHIPVGGAYPIIPLDDPNNVVLFGPGYDDNETGYNRNVGFDFPLWNIVYNTVSVSCNGTISLRSNNGNNYNSINIMSYDLHTHNGSILENTSYNGIYAVTWNNNSWYSGRGPVLNMQMLLFGPNNSMNVGSGSIVFNYGNIDSHEGYHMVSVGDSGWWSSNINSINLSSILSTSTDGYISDITILANKSFIFQPNNDGTYRVSEY